GDAVSNVTTAASAVNPTAAAGSGGTLWWAPYGGHPMVGTLWWAPYGGMDRCAGAGGCLLSRFRRKRFILASTSLHLLHSDRGLRVAETLSYPTAITGIVKNLNLLMAFQHKQEELSAQLPTNEFLGGYQGEISALLSETRKRKHRVHNLELSSTNTQGSEWLTVTLGSLWLRAPGSGKVTHLASVFGTLLVPGCQRTHEPSNRKSSAVTAIPRAFNCVVFDNRVQLGLVYVCCQQSSGRADQSCAIPSVTVKKRGFCWWNIMLAAPPHLLLLLLSPVTPQSGKSSTRGVKDGGRSEQEREGAALNGPSGLLLNRETVRISRGMYYKIQML
ncbi:hypothetical protein FQN60_015983, partial [Etheostoma spectabile]